MVERLLKVRNSQDTVLSIWSNQIADEAPNNNDYFPGGWYSSESEVRGRLHPDHASAASLQSGMCPSYDEGQSLVFLRLTGVNVIFDHLILGAKK